MRALGSTLALGLVGAGVIGGQILVKDQWLWNAAPSHAYGLAAFVILDLILAALVLWRIRPISFIVAIVTLVQISAMVADLVAGQPQGLPSTAFRNYLLNDNSYVGLLIDQATLLAITLSSLTAPFLHRHVHRTSLFSPKRR